MCLENNFLVRRDSESEKEDGGVWEIIIGYENI